MDKFSKYTTPLLHTEEISEDSKLATEFFAAISWNDTESVRKMLKEELELVQARTVLCLQTPLHKAANKGQIEIVNILLVANTNVHAKNFIRQTPLHEAAEEGHYKVTKALLSAGEDVMEEDIPGDTPYDRAVDKRGENDPTAILLFSVPAKNIKPTNKSHVEQQKKREEQVAENKKKQRLLQPYVNTNSKLYSNN